MFRSFDSDKLSKISGEDEDDSGYTIIGGDAVEVLPEEKEDNDDDTGNDDD